MVDATKTEETEEATSNKDIPAIQLGNANLMAIPENYVRQHFDKVMAWAENWSNTEFGTPEVNLRRWKGEVVFGPALHHKPLRHHQ